MLEDDPRTPNSPKGLQQDLHKEGKKDLKRARFNQIHKSKDLGENLPHKGGRFQVLNNWSKRIQIQGDQNQVNTRKEKEKENLSGKQKEKTKNQPLVQATKPPSCPNPTLPSQQV